MHGRRADAYDSLVNDIEDKIRDIERRKRQRRNKSVVDATDRYRDWDSVPTHNRTADMSWRRDYPRDSLEFVAPLDFVDICPQQIVALVRPLVMDSVKQELAAFKQGFVKQSSQVPAIGSSKSFALEAQVVIFFHLRFV